MAPPHISGSQGEKDKTPKDNGGSIGDKIAGKVGKIKKIIMKTKPTARSEVWLSNH